MDPSQIKPIDKTSVHRICSGQVVLNLAVAVKELIENSLDAGATIINVRLKQYGSELLEVSDNGSGVHPDNFEGLTLKHHTSKLRDFSDLESVATFGFRGEALSSLCALSKVTISTRHKSQDVGTCLTFQHTGAIASTNHIPRQVGTTVSLANLFSTLPVRQKEFHRNLKKEFQKMSQLLNAYCLVSTGVKITCTNQTNKENKHVSTLGCPTVKENISSVFGPKQLTNLLELKTVRPSEEVLEEMKIDGNAVEMFKLEGFISSCAHGCGRAAGDRQFYFINSRPCDLSKVSKAVNEVYHQYNVHQVPFVFMNIIVERNSVDVNVTPDKRQVFLDQEKLLIATIKASLTELYEKIPSTYTVNHLKRPQNQTQVSSPKIDSKLSLSKFSQFRHKNDLKRELPHSNNASVQKAKQMKLDNHFTKNQKDEDNNSTKNYPLLTSSKCGNIDEKTIDIDSDKTKMDCAANSPESTEIICEEKCARLNETETVELLEKRSYCNETEQLSTLNSVEKSLLGENLKNKNSKFNADEIAINSDKNDNCEEEKLNNFEKIINSQVCNEDMGNDQINSLNNLNFSKNDTVQENIEQNDAKVDHIKELECGNFEEDEDLKEIDVNLDDEQTVQIDFNDEIPDRRTVNIEFNIDMLKTSCLLKEQSQKRVDNPFIKFRSTIDPSKNSEAEQELNKEISKDMFSKMDIVGQFNLGFIITKLGSDLFIVDQHATDEKYNFETLQQTTTLSNQKLVVPQNLELTAANECILLDNLDVFKKNGFEFQIDENEAAFKKVKLSAIPMSKNWIFGKEDVDELIFMLQDVSPGTMCRPSRVRSMFASRACRMSVMIGSHLSLKDMRKLIDHMGQIEQPWNCPHGRPTMRHLINLELTD